MKIEASYLICTIPRTGSTYMSALLGETQQLGFPREHLVAQTEEKTRFQDESYGDYVDRVVREKCCSPNGVCGLKIMWNTFEHMLTELRAELAGSPEDKQSDLQLISRFFPNPHFVFLVRNDKLRQAISLTRAKQSKKWHSWNKPWAGEKQQEERFNYFEIAQDLERIQTMEQAWEQFFTEHAIIPTRMSYEDFTADPKKGVRQITDLLGHDPLTELPQVPYEMKKMRDRRTERWLVCYRVLDLVQRMIPRRVLRGVKPVLGRLSWLRAG